MSNQINRMVCLQEKGEREGFHPSSLFIIEIGVKHETSKHIKWQIYSKDFHDL